MTRLRCSKFVFVVVLALYHPGTRIVRQLVESNRRQKLDALVCNFAFLFVCFYLSGGRFTTLNVEQLQAEHR